MRAWTLRRIGAVTGALVTGIVLTTGIMVLTGDDANVDTFGPLMAVNCLRHPDNPRCRPRPTVEPAMTPTSTPEAPWTPTVVAPATPAPPTATATTGPVSTALPTASLTATASPVQPSQTCAGVPAYPEQRPDNVQANQTRVAKPAWTTTTFDGAFKPYYDKITADCQGTTRQILEWAAQKWGIPVDRFLAHAVKESNWHQSQLGDRDATGWYCSRGILQLRMAENNCGGWPYGYPGAAESTAYVADYAAAEMRFNYDGGTASWGTNATGDWDKTSQAYFCGCANTGTEPYVTEVKQYQADKPWLRSGF